MTKFFPHSTGNFGPLSMIRLMLGQSIPSQPQMMIDRIIFMTIVMTFVWISVNDFYSNIIKIQFEQFEKLFNSYEDLEKLNLLVITTSNKLILDKNEHYLLEKVHNLTITATIFESCLFEKNVICIVREWEAIKVIENTRKIGGSLAVKIAELPIGENILHFYVIKNGASYAKKIFKLSLRVAETGLNNLISDIHSYYDDYDIVNIQKKNKDYSVMALTFGNY